MAILPQRVKPIRDLIQVATSHASAVLPDEMRQSFPIPIESGGRAVVVFLYCPSRLVPREGQYLLPPSHRAIVNAETGALEELTQIQLGAIGPRHGPGEALGVHARQPGETLEEAEARQEQLLDAYDAVLPAYFARQTRVAADVRHAAARFLDLFDRAVEAPLLPYYHQLGRDFFMWLGAAAQTR